MNWKLLLAAAVSGLTPIAINLVSADITYLATVTTPELIGYCIRGVALMFLAVIAVAMQADKLDIPRAIQVGLAGPALITSLIQGQALKQPDVKPATSWILPSEAMADGQLRTRRRLSTQERDMYWPTVTRPVTAPVEPVVAPKEEESTMDSLWRGFTGQRSRQGK